MIAGVTARRENEAPLAWRVCFDEKAELFQSNLKFLVASSLVVFHRDCQGCARAEKRDSITHQLFERLDGLVT